MRDSFDSFIGFLKSHKLEFACAIVAILIGIVVIIIGLWKTLFLGVLALIGYSFGRKINTGMSIGDVLRNIIDNISNVIRKIFK